jgi:hypothetical protein
MHLPVYMHVTCIAVVHFEGYVSGRYGTGLLDFTVFKTLSTYSICSGEMILL